MKIAVATLAAATALLSLDGRAGIFASVGGGVSDWGNGVCDSHCDRRDGAWYGRAGVSILPFIGIEARYVDLGRSKSSAQLAASPAVSVDSTTDSKGAGVGAVLQVPIPLDLTLNAVAGFARMQSRGSVDSVTFSNGNNGFTTIVGTSASQSKINPYYGVGIDFGLARTPFSVGAEATRYRVELGGKSNVDTYTVSFTYRFL